MAHRWSNKEDVLKDLEVATGHQVTDVDDGYFLYGEQPPPPRVVDNEGLCILCLFNLIIGLRLRMRLRCF